MEAGTGILWVVSLFGGYALSDAPAMPIDEWGMDRLAPLHANRQIDTTSLQWRAREKVLLDGRASLRLGATVSRATGRIEQVGADGAYTLESPAWGVGPAMDGRFTLIERGGWRLTMDASAAVLVYDRRFPAGGYHYNGMLQLGPSIGFAAGSRGHFDAGWRWMHVSNGQGLGPHNPSYEARGLTLRWQAQL